MIRGPLVSCITPFLNAERFLEEAIQSVLAQDYADWELLLIDDGAKDGSAKIAEEYARRHPTQIRYLCHPSRANRGVSAARNLGIAHIDPRAAYVAFLDADDVWLPHKLGRQVAIAQSHPEAAMVYGQVELWRSWQPDAPGPDSVVDLGVTPDRVILPPRLLRNLLLFKYQTPVPSNTLIRKQVLERIGGFQEEFRIYEDQALFAQIFLDHPVYVASERWVRYRQHADSASAWMANSVDNIAAYCATRLAFLDWLTALLSERGVRDPRIWLPLLKERAFCQRPALAKSRQLLQRQAWQIYLAARSIAGSLRRRQSA